MMLSKADNMFKDEIKQGIRDWTLGILSLEIIMGYKYKML